MATRTAAALVDGRIVPLASGDTLQDAGGNTVGGGGVDTSGTPVANDIARFTDADTIEGLSYSELKTALDLEIGTDIQAYDAGLTDIAGLAVTDGNIIVGNGTNWVAESGATARTSLGLGTANSPQFTGIELGHASDTTITRASAGNVNIEGNLVYRAGGTDVPVTDGGTGASDASGARTNLGLVIGTDVQAYDAELAAIAGLTSAANKVPYFTGSGTAGLLDFLDEDNMSSDSATAVPSQQSVKAYVDALIASTLSSEVSLKGDYNASTNTPDLDTSPSGIKKGDTYVVTAAGTFFTTAVEVGDVLMARIDDAAVEADWIIVNKNIDAATTTIPGIVELATTAETTTGTDATKAVTPDSLHDMTSLAGAAWFLDEDTMSSNSATKVASQQSIKAYVDTEITAHRRRVTFTETFYTDGQNQLTSANVMDVTCPYAGYIVATSVKASGARTAGTISLQPHINGTGLTPTGLDLELSAAPTTKDSATVAYGTSGYSVSADDAIGFIADTTTFAPLANSFTVSITVELT